MVFGSWEIWHIAFLVLIQAGSHPLSFTLTFEFEQIQKSQNKTSMNQLTFTWFPPKIINFAPFANGRLYSKRYTFQMPLTGAIFKSREEDDPNSSDFSRMRGPHIQLTFSEILFTREVVLRIGKNQSKGLSPLLASFLRKHEYVIPTSTLKFIFTGHFGDGLSTADFLDITLTRRCHSPKRKLSHILWGHLKWKLQQRHLDA